MIITNREELAKYSAPYRVWQGIPGVEVTAKGRLFVTFYSGGIEEQNGNYVLLFRSDNGGDFGEPIAVVLHENHRCYDPCLWIDPLRRLWLIWSCAPDHAVYAVICDDPDAEELVWSDEMRLGKDVMMNKPTVLSTGEWLFPIAVWNYNMRAGGFHSELEDDDRKAFAYESADGGRTFRKLGGTDLVQRCYDEHMFLELEDGRLAMYVRTHYGIGVAYSLDGGKTWTEGEDSGFGGPDSRFHIRRLPSGRVLLINHYQYTGRNNLTAMLSEDDCKTWKYKLLLDGRKDVSYPDAAVDADGNIYVVYDRERGGYKKSLEEVYGSAREVLMAKITEQDIIDGSVTQPGSYLQRTVSKLEKYAMEDQLSFENRKAPW